MTVNSDTLYNAVNVSLSYKNLTYVSSSVVSGWTTIAGPSNAANTVSFTGAILGQGSASTGAKQILNIVFNAPSNVIGSSVTSSGTLAQANSIGTQISVNSATNSVSSSAAPTSLPNTGMFENILGLMVIGIVVIATSIFRQ